MMMMRMLQGVTRKKRTATRPIGPYKAVHGT